MPEVQQLSGLGIKGLETDPPLYHFDVSPEELNELITDPEGFLDRAGLREKGIGRAGVKVTLARFHEYWSHVDQTWKPVEDPGIAARGCCYVSDDEVICHRH